MKMATAEYDKMNCTRINLKLNNKTDADIIDRLEKEDNMQGFIKNLIRNEIKGEKKMTKFGWHIIHQFAGNPTWEELNKLIAFDSGVEEPYCETEEDYKQAVKEGWIKYDGKTTTVWEDGEYED